jgi:hypothetical protein
MNCFTKSLKIFSISLLPLVSFGQIINKGLYQVYERQDIVNTALRLNNDSTYTVQATVINCSLCDHDTLHQIVYQKGTWTIVNDTLVLFDKVNETNNKLIIENPETLKPLYLIGLMIDKSKMIVRKNTPVGR